MRGLFMYEEAAYFRVQVSRFQRQMDAGMSWGGV